MKFTAFSFSLFFFFLSIKKNNTLLPLTWLAALTNDPRPSSLPCWDHGTVHLQLAGAPHQSGCIPLSLTGGAPASTSARLLLITRQSQHSTPPDPSATFYSTFFFLRFCPPPYFCDDKMGLEVPLTGQLVPFCCSKSGSVIIWEIII